MSSEQLIPERQVLEQLSEPLQRVWKHAAAAISNPSLLTMDNFRSACRPADLLVALRELAEFRAHAADQKDLYMTWCQEESREGTVHITSVRASNAQEAAREGRSQCARDWGWESREDEIHCIGVMRHSDLSFELWDDENCVIE